MSSSLHLACFQSLFMLEYLSVLYLFLWPNNIPYYDTSFYLPIHLLIDIWIVSQIFNFWQLWTKNHVQLSVFNSFGYISMHELAGSYNNPRFNLLTIFHSSCTILHSQQQCIRISITSHPHQNFLFSIVSYSCDPSGCEMVSHSGIDLHFNKLYWCWASFHVLGSQ